ncbi:DUF1223 domain-containing protein [Neptunomonas qingdaonensis]|nr:DUF1223 domain-containing protein [Neptunomonas qingdaonensis]
MTHPSVFAGFFFMVGGLSPLAATATQLFEQSGSVPQLIQLYTSEGCSSCPPADRNLRALLNDPKLWTQRLPVAFHVDYWDYIGWKDPYAQPQFKERQYALKKSGAIESIYTPGWVVDGKEWKGFFLGQALPAPPSRQGGKLKVEVNDNQQVTVSYQGVPNSPDSDPITAHLVLLSFNQTSHITAGENSGKTLQHDFVAVQELQSVNQTPEWRFSLPGSDLSTQKAMVVWLTSENSPQPLQATGGWLE